ncbi:MAG: NAD(P)-dependent glycerol-3-phosphate dehydrogenase [Alphaproteobacteria bacterium]|nr:NAD(P)-dependent glycerol-3-phosphate dehydrogenase [Alphaproteobacteria bacterium]
MKKIGLIGAGIWGTGLALTAARAGCEVMAWALEDEVVSSINHQHCNTMYLPDIPLPDTIKATSNITDVLNFADNVLMVVSAQHTRSVIEKIKDSIRPENRLILCAKGIELNTGYLLSEVVEQVRPGTKVAVLSGPGFAREVALMKPTATTLACEEENCAAELAEMIGTKFFRPYTTTDIIAPQIGGSVKNVIALATGAIEGAGWGDNARAAVICRGLHEMTCIAKAMGGHMRTMMGMSGLGDLVLTATATQSRNFSFGYEIGRLGIAKPLLDSNTKTVEGILTAPAVLKRAKELNVEMPICETVNNVLFNGMPLKDAMDELLSRPFKDEGFQF